MHSCVARALVIVSAFEALFNYEMQSQNIRDEILTLLNSKKFLENQHWKYRFPNLITGFQIPVHGQPHCVIVSQKISSIQRLSTKIVVWYVKESCKKFMKPLSGKCDLGKQICHIAAHAFCVIAGSVRHFGKPSLSSLSGQLQNIRKFNKQKIKFLCSYF